MSDQKSGILVSYHLQLMPDCSYLSTTVHVQIENETFTITGKTLLNAGFTKVSHISPLAEEKHVSSVLPQLGFLFFCSSPIYSLFIFVLRCIFRISLIG